jgi:hypothetical protein
MTFDRLMTFTFVGGGVAIFVIVVALLASKA